MRARSMCVFCFLFFVKKERCYIFGVSFNYGCKINKAEAVEIGFKTESNEKIHHRATKLRCTWVEHVAEQVTGTRPRPETNWCDVMRK